MIFARAGAKDKLGLRVHGLIVGSPDKKRADPAVLRSLCSHVLPSGKQEVRAGWGTLEPLESCVRRRATGGSPPAPHPTHPPHPTAHPAAQDLARAERALCSAAGGWESPSTAGPEERVPGGRSLVLLCVCVESWLARQCPHACARRCW